MNQGNDLKWTCEPVDDTNLCGSCQFGRTVLRNTGIDTAYVWCNMWLSEFSIDDGCKEWRRKDA